MKHYVGLDVALKETAICIVDDERRVVREGSGLDQTTSSAPAEASGRDAGRR